VFCEAFLHDVMVSKHGFRSGYPLENKMNNQIEREVWLTLSYEEAEKSLNYVSLLCDSFDLMAIAGEDIFAKETTDLAHTMRHRLQSALDEMQNRKLQ
jgi:hypothetical protein